MEKKTPYLINFIKKLGIAICAILISLFITKFNTYAYDLETDSGITTQMIINNMQSGKESPSADMPYINYHLSVIEPLANGFADTFLSDMPSAQAYLDALQTIDFTPFKNNPSALITWRCANVDEYIVKNIPQYYSALKTCAANKDTNGMTNYGKCIEYLFRLASDNYQQMANICNAFPNFNKVMNAIPLTTSQASTAGKAVNPKMSKWRTQAFINQSPYDLQNTFIQLSGAYASWTAHFVITNVTKDVSMNAKFVITYPDGTQRTETAPVTISKPGYSLYYSNSYTNSPAGVLSCQLYDGDTGMLLGTASCNVK